MPEQTNENLLDRLFIAAPCSVSWDSMQGDERVRNCSLCSRQVYNISDMTKRQAEEFLAANDTSQCMRFYRRKDGTIMTDNCPVGLRKLRRSLRHAVGLISSATAIILGLPSALAQGNFRGAFTPPPAPPGMEYRPNPAGGGYILRPAGQAAGRPVMVTPGSPNAVTGSPPPHLQITNYEYGHPVNSGANPPSDHADRKVMALYLKAKEYEQNGNSLVAAIYYQSALDQLSDQKSFDPGFKRLIEKELQELKHGSQSQPQSTNRKMVPLP